ncbi:unnamed protein product [Adineta steineri]|uniref:Tyrosine-protein kinase n=1 Tax=Adineta steineri TaxID=433720 RepID=A0A815NTY6_9BILA|nr:unnamed protein product [Adineta steineri]CAF1438332.1 unnamed protein product [Adineta steineri]
MTMNHHRRIVVPGAPNDGSNALLKYFFSHEGCRILSTIVTDEYKILQETKKILEKRISLDEQYAKNLQDLTANADRIIWPGGTHPIASVSRDVLLRWSYLASTISTQAEQFRKNIIDDLLKELVEHKIDSRKYFDEEKRRYDGEHRKAQNDVLDVEKRYSDDIKSYLTKNNELTKLQNNAKKGDDSRIKHLKDIVIDKRSNLYRTHNEYIYKIREYNFIDEQYVRKIRSLINYHEAIQVILNKSWQNVLDAVANYYSEDSVAAIKQSRQLISSINPYHSYDELCTIYSHTPPITPSPQVYNMTLFQATSLTKVKSDQFVVDNSTKQDLKQRIEILTNSINESIPILVNLPRDKITYDVRKKFFEQEQQTNYLRAKKKWEEQLRNEFKSVLKDVGYRSDDNESNLDSDDDDLTDRLEDQAYFHGVLPRTQSISQLKENGDYLVRKNEQGKIVLSIMWNDIRNPNTLKHAHFYINEDRNMYSLQPGGVSKASVNELISFYKRQKLTLRDDGVRLIRPITRPDYIVNNDDVHKLEVIGKGHFGEVVRAEYRGEYVAVKILHPSTTDRNAEDRKNFIKEALLLQQYKHKNIVKFLGIAAIRDPLMIIMELIEQGSLDKYLKNNDLRLSQLIQMCYDIVKGMEYLEQCNIIHRDLAARNCLVDRKGRIKVADFGLSRCLQSDEEYFCQVKTIPVRWWAVEVFSNAPYTNKSDVWSYGVTAWEVFSKADLPYSHIQFNHTVINAIKNGERLKQPDRCPVKIYTIMATCWQLDPQDRPNFEKLVELIRKEKTLF